MPDPHRNPEGWMMPKRRIELTERHARFITNEVASGRYRTESEVLQEGVRILEKLQERERRKLKALQAIARAGIDQLNQGLGVVLNGDDELEKYIRKLGKKASSSVKSKTR